MTLSYQTQCEVRRHQQRDVTFRSTQHTSARPGGAGRWLNVTNPILPSALKKEGRGGRKDAPSARLLLRPRHRLRLLQRLCTRRADPGRRRQGPEASLSKIPGFTPSGRRGETYPADLARSKMDAVDPPRGYQAELSAGEDGAA